MKTLEPSTPAALLDQARRLVVADGRAAPHQIDIRRATSNAYYAVFHDIAGRAAAQVVGGPADATVPVPPRSLHVVRWFTHGALIEACAMVRRLDRPEVDPSWRSRRRSAWRLLHEDDPAAPSASLLDTSRRIVSLHALRSRADYDFAEPLQRHTALGAIDSAAFVVEVLRRDADSPAFRGFFVLVTMSARGGAQG